MRNSIINGVKKGINSSTKIASFTKRKLGEWRIVIKNANNSSQYSKMENLLSEDEFILIILDSCRYDYFKNSCTEHFGGELEKIYTTNTYTKQYLRNVWTENYDVTYVAGGPVINDETFRMSGDQYRPSEHFSEIIDVWDLGYETELGVTPPEAVTETALKRDDSRMVVHYFQPHAPYIGEERLRKDDFASDTVRRGTLEHRSESLKDIYQKVESGEINESDLANAYCSNLYRVLSAVKPLIVETDKRTVLTSDHGELLGEDGRYMHGGLPHPLLCEVPWFEVNGVRGNISEHGVSYKGEERRVRSVEEQLQDLGYL